MERERSIKTRVMVQSSSIAPPRHWTVSFVLCDAPDQAFDEFYHNAKQLKDELQKAIGDLPAGLHFKYLEIKRAKQEDAPEKK